VSRKFVQFFGKNISSQNVERLLFLSPYPVNCCRSGLSFIRCEVLVAVKIHILMSYVKTACRLFSVETLRTNKLTVSLWMSPDDRSTVLLQCDNTFSDNPGQTYLFYLGLCIQRQKYFTHSIPFSSQLILVGWGSILPYPPQRALHIA
jgi:hypothetical protein